MAAILSERDVEITPAARLVMERVRAYEAENPLSVAELLLRKRMQQEAEQLASLERRARAHGRQLAPTSKSTPLPYVHVRSTIPHAPKIVGQVHNGLAQYHQTVATVQNESQTRSQTAIPQGTMPVRLTPAVSTNPTFLPGIDRISGEIGRTVGEELERETMNPEKEAAHYAVRGEREQRIRDKQSHPGILSAFAIFKARSNRQPWTIVTTRNRELQLRTVQPTYTQPAEHEIISVSRPSRDQTKLEQLTITRVQPIMRAEGGVSFETIAAYMSGLIERNALQSSARDIPSPKEHLKPVLNAMSASAKQYTSAAQHALHTTVTALGKFFSAAKKGLVAAVHEYQFLRDNPKYAEQTHRYASQRTASTATVQANHSHTAISAPLQAEQQIRSVPATQTTHNSIDDAFETGVDAMHVEDVVRLYDTNKNEKKPRNPTRAAGSIYQRVHDVLDYNNIALSATTGKLSDERRHEMLAKSTGMSVKTVEKHIRQHALVQAVYEGLTADPSRMPDHYTGKQAIDHQVAFITGMSKTTVRAHLAAEGLYQRPKKEAVYKTVLVTA